MILLPLDASVKLIITTINLIMSVSQVFLSVRPRGKTEPPLDGFLWILYLRIFRKAVKKIVQRITGSLHEDLCTVALKSR